MNNNISILNDMIQAVGDNIILIDRIQAEDNNFSSGEKTLNNKAVIQSMGPDVGETLNVGDTVYYNPQSAIYIQEHDYYVVKESSIIAKEE